MLRVACLCLGLLLVPACASQQVVDRFADVTVGMTKDEVVALLGKPDRAYCVDFDDAGKVVAKAAPTWVEQTEQ